MSRSTWQVALGFGPDVEWLDGVDYDVDPARADRFYPAVRSWYPSLPDGALQPAYSGIRPKISAQGEPAADFVIQGQGARSTWIGESVWY